MYDWSQLYPGIDDNRVEFADIGCGYGGFLGIIYTKSNFTLYYFEFFFCLVKLGELFPDKFAIGMEIRVKVSDYVMDRIQALRHMHPDQYRNIACLRTNAMKYLPNFFAKHQLSKIFFLYPDPHFKRSKHKWRIISQPLLTEYSYVLRPGVSSAIYCIYLVLICVIFRLLGNHLYDYRRQGSTRLDG